ncbi:MAG: glycosyltransferase, partial [Planctomycetota bacterium]
RLREAGIPTYDLGGWKPRHFFRAYRSLRRLIRDEKPDLIHTHLFHATVIGRLASLRSRIPTVATVHIAERRKRPWHFRLDRWTRFRCRAWTAVSAAVADFHARKAKIPRERFEVIHNGIDLGRFAPPADRREAKKRLGLEAEGLTVGAFGRFDPQKGLDLFLEAVSRLAPRHPETRFVLAGYGPEEAQYRARIGRDDLKGRVLLLGRQDRPEALYQALDIFAFPSRYEGFGLVLVEAMACGAAVVAAKVDSVPEILAEDARAGILVEPENPDALARALERLIRSEAERQALSVRARKRAEDFSLTSMVAKYEALYARILPADEESAP